MVSASKANVNLLIDYDPSGQLHKSTLNGLSTTFLYNEDELIAEYNSSGVLINRYVHGIAKDDPLVWYIGAGTENKRFLLANERSSIVAETNNTGSVIATHQYSPYSEPENNSTSRFRYTGQILIPGTKLYYYKARVYHPKLGRFMQTDPIGYDDGMNWYAYVGNDPVNMVDPTGKTTEKIKDKKPKPKQEKTKKTTKQKVREKAIEKAIEKATEKIKSEVTEEWIKKRREAGRSEDQICREVECSPKSLRKTYGIFGSNKCAIKCNDEYAVKGKKYGKGKE